MAKNVKRLLEQFKPEHYDLELSLDKKSLLFDGTVTVRGKKVGRPSRRIILHQKDLKITSATITRHDKSGDQEVPVQRINTHASFNEVRLHAKEMAYPGSYTLVLTFSGKITRPMSGIYPSFFKLNGKEEKILSTQFESHHAREAFPCIDEPEAKATFDLTLHTAPNETVLSNTPVKTQTRGKGTVTTTFETTPLMSTYLLAFAVGQLQYKEAKTKGGVVIRTYATPENVKHTDFALDFAVRCLEFYDDYFGIKYPLPKCDLIALPDFAAGAMENWGCITFREQCLIVDPKNTSLHVKQYVAMVIAHELAHQWFGNLVTMRWWTDLWLNEGFASWIEFLAVDHIFPEWNMWTQFIVDEQLPAFKLDALEHTHPVEVPVKHPDEIRTIFDTISYSKGASVIHMLHDYLGAGDFKDGLRHYLEKHAYGNTDTVDLWSALEEVSQKPVMAFMQTWTGQSGFPIVETATTKDTVALSQQRFYLNPGARKTATQALWPIPLLANRNDLPGTLDQETMTVQSKGTDALLLNKSQSGFYRVIYSPSHRQQLGRQVRDGTLPPLDRLRLLSDSFEASKAGYTNTVEAFALMENYTDEDNAAVWEVIAGNLHAVRAVMDDEQLRNAMKPYIRKLASRQVERLGWKTKVKEPHFDRLLRPTVLGLASIGEDTSVVDEALRQFKDMKRPEDVEPDLRGVVYGTAVRHGSEDEFNKLLAMHNATTNSEERTTIAAALTGFKQPKLAKRALALITTDTVRLQDAGYWIAYSFMNRHSKLLTWQWLKDNWDWLSENLSSDMSYSRYPLYAARPFSDLEFLKEYRKFFQGVTTPSLERSIRQGIETVEWQADWRRRDASDLKQYFSSRQ